MYANTDSTTRRLRGINLLLKHGSNGKESVEIEAAVASMVIHSRIRCDYEAKIRQLAWNLKKNPELHVHPAEVLVRLDDKTMARGTDVEQWTTAFEMELEKETHLVNPESHSSSLLKCRRCKSERISTKQVQTRGADEAMTVFCSCDDCSLRWKM
jgi:transcription elongation factor S-II